MAEQSNEKIIKLLQEKVLLKQDVIENTKVVFNTFKEILSKISAELKSSTGKISKDVIANYKDTGENEAEFTLADETLLFVIHTNIFTFDKTHEVWKTKYVQQDSKRAFCGKIFIYNFLSDSFLYNRINDVGYLISRIFINF